MAVLDTSAQALHGLGEHRLNKLQQEIYDIVLAHSRKGVADMTGAEIREAWEVLHASARLDKSSVSARLNALVKLGRLARRPDSRECRAWRPEGVKASTAYPVFVPCSEHAGKQL